MTLYVGWLKLHRKIRQNPIWQDESLLKAFLYFLTEASIRDDIISYRGELVKVKAGQCLTGRKRLKVELNYSENKVRRVLKQLEKLGIIHHQTSRRYSLITVVLWKEYQHILPTEGTTEGTTDHQQKVHSIRSKELKEVKNKKDPLPPKKIPLIEKVKSIFSDVTADSELKELLHAFADDRKSKKKPLTENAARLNYKKLCKLSGDIGEQIAIVEQTIANGYQGFFELKESFKGFHKKQPVSQAQRMKDLYKKKFGEEL